MSSHALDSGFDLTMNITVDENSKSGLKGIPEQIETKILASFRKSEIIENPIQVLTAYLENEIRQAESVAINYEDIGSAFDYQPDFHAQPQEARHTYRIPDNSVYLKQIKAEVFKKLNPAEKY